VNIPMMSAAQMQHLKVLVQSGLPITERPYLALAERVGVTEAAVIRILDLWHQEGLIKRFGLVVKHRALGYRANAMVVWDIPDADVPVVGEKLAASTAVTLCYQRPRKLPGWPYNLFCMIHGRSRESVLAQLARLVEQHQLHSIPKDVLFSYKEFKQCGARYVSELSDPSTVTGVLDSKKKSDLSLAAYSGPQAVAKDVSLRGH
jgi:DNA-binding Lrp family transcriptional regulator